MVSTGAKGRMLNRNKLVLKTTTIKKTATTTANTGGFLQNISKFFIPFVILSRIRFKLGSLKKCQTQNH